MMSHHRISPWLVFWKQTHLLYSPLLSCFPMALPFGACITFLMSPNIAVLAAFLIVFLLYFRSGIRKSNAPRSSPPGPKPVFVLGNILDLTRKELWLKTRKWAKEYGSICCLHIFGQSLVFLNTPKTVLDLLDKRGAIYSDRPHLVMLGELCGCKDIVPFTAYGDQSKRQRKLMQQALGRGSIREYHPLIGIETRIFLRRLLDNPCDYTDAIKRYAGGLILLLIYGYEVKSEGDKFLSMAEETIWLLSNRISPSADIWLVDVLPFLKYIPTWVPGMGFKRNAIKWKAQIEEFVNQPFEFAQENIKSGIALASFCKTLFDSDRSIHNQESSDVKWTAGSMYAAGSIDTTVALVSHFILIIIQHPEVLVKAQNEIDCIVGNGRLPNFNDRESLPYIESLMSECLRWAAPVPLGLPHRLMEDDVYNDMYIPKGTIIVANIWAILRDETLYPSPDIFNPDRFIDEADEQTQKRRDPRNFVFGFGRRRCPGSYLIESSAWLLIVSMIAVFDMSKAVDEHGNIIEPNVQFNDSVFRTPTPFKCSIKPRSEQAARLV